MCEIDGGSDGGFDVDTDYDVSTDSDISEGFDSDVNIDMDSVSAFDDMDDIDMSSDDLESENSVFDDVAGTEESLSLESLDDINAMIDESSDIADLSELRDTLLNGEYNENGENEFIEELGDESLESESQEINLGQLEDVEPLMLDESFLEELIEQSDDPEIRDKLDELRESGRIITETTEESNEEGRAYTREITPEILESRNNDTEEVLDNYRENLLERGVSQEQIEEFVNQERDKINAEYESLGAGDLSENIYHAPTDWDAVATSIMDGDSENISDGKEITASTIEEMTGTDDLQESYIDIPTVDSAEITIEGLDELTDSYQEFSEESEAGIEDVSLSELPDIDGTEDEGITDDIPEDDVFETSEDTAEEVEEDIEQENISEEINAGEVEDDFDHSIMETNNLTDIDLSETSEISVEDAEIENEIDGEIEITDESLDLNQDVQELAINYDEIYEELDQASLEQGFENIDIYTDTERLDSSLEHFEESNWEQMSLDEQKESMADLADYVIDTVGFDKPPQIEYYNNPREGDYGGYNPVTNTLRVNEYMLYNSSEAADTIAHELWHAHQHECAENPQTARDYQYQYNFENYITPELGHEAYENQLIEAEARAFAAQFKGRLASISGRTR